MFGSIGWAVAMLFLGIALDRSTSFPNHPCAKPSDRERNYTVCFATFSCLMGCAFLVATQFRFDYEDDEAAQVGEFEMSKYGQKKLEKIPIIITIIIMDILLTLRFFSKMSHLIHTLYCTKYEYIISRFPIAKSPTQCQIHKPQINLGFH